jgi:hypothetical protein
LSLKTAFLGGDVDGAVGVEKLGVLAAPVFKELGARALPGSAAEPGISGFQGGDELLAE